MDQITGHKPLTGFTVLKYVLLFIPAFIYFHYVNKDAVNIPWQDDYDAVLRFLTDYKAASFSDKLSLLFLQHNEHRIFSSRLVYVVYNFLFGYINFRHLIFIADSQVAFIFLIIVSLIKKLLPDNWFLPSLAASMCLFDINNWENANFAMAGMQNYGVIFLCCLSIWLYTKYKKAFIALAVLCQAICMFSSGNGIVASAFVAAFTILSKNRVKAICGTLTFLVSAPLYFLHYNSPASGHPATDMGKIIPYFLDLFGSHVIFNNDKLQMIVGFILVVALIFFQPVTKKLKIKDGTLPLLCVLGFLVSSMVVTAIFRCNVPGIPANSSRYLIYSNFVVALLFVFIVYRLKNRLFKGLVTLPYIVMLMVGYNMNVNHNKLVFDNMRSALLTTPYYYPDQEVAKRIATQACLQKIYCIEDHRQGK